MHRRGLIAAALLLGAVTASQGWAAETRAALRVEGFEQADAIRDAVAAELGPALDTDPRPELAVAVTEDEVRVRYQQQGRPTLERAIPRPARDDEVVDAVAWLAGNLARDQTSALLSSLGAPDLSRARRTPIDPSTDARAASATAPDVRAAPSPLVTGSPLDPQLRPDHAEPDEGWSPRPTALAFTSSASLVNAGAHLRTGPLAVQLTAAAHPFGRTWLGGQLGAGLDLHWDGPFLGVMASYAYFQAVDPTDVALDATASSLEWLTIDERHQVGLLASGGYQVTDWLGLFLGLGARVDVGLRPPDSSPVLPDVTAGVRLF